MGGRPAGGKGDQWPNHGEGVDSLHHGERSRVVSSLACSESSNVSSWSPPSLWSPPAH